MADDRPPDVPAPAARSTAIVIPCYNEARRLEPGAFRDFAAGDRQTRFLFVDDGSRDDTAAVLERLASCDPDGLTLHRLPANRGKAEAVRQGMLAALAGGPGFVGYWDADLATPLAEIARFRTWLEERPGVELAIGSRVQLLGRAIERRPARHYFSRVFATLASLVLDLPVYDTQCGAKLFRVTERTAPLFERPFSCNWTFDVELLARVIHAAVQSGLRPEELIHEVPLWAWRDVAGSKVRAVDFCRAMRDLWRIWRIYRPGRVQRRTFDS